MGDRLTSIKDALKTLVGVKKHFVSAVILAAGSGERFSAEIKKQLYELDGIPVAVRTLLAFEKCDIINEIVLVVRSDEIDIMHDLANKYGITKLRSVVAGGASRQESSVIGFEAIDPAADFALFHDGARCLVTDDIIKATVEDAMRYGAAIAAEKSVDTVKLASDDGFVSETVDRRKVWLAKTPQVFMANMYRAGAYMAKKDGAEVTDDAMLAERLGFKVKLTDCGHENIKITTQDDITAALAIIEKRKAAEK